MLFGDHVLSQEEKLFCWRFEILEIQLSVGATCGCGEGMARQRENRESREGFLIPEYSGKVTGTQRGGYQTASIMWESDTVRWQMISRKRTENRGWKQCAVQDFLARDGDPQPQDRSKFIVKSGSKQMGSLGGVSISLLSISTIPNPELSSIQCMKNITVMIQNKHLFAHIICYFLVGTNVRICFLQIDCLCSS